jgi:hypothetical protein
LVDHTGRLFRKGKAAISAELAGIFDRLGSGAETLRVRLEKLRTGRLFGRFCAASRERLQEEAGRLDVRRVANLVEVGRDDAILNCESHRARSQPSPLFPTASHRRSSPIISR